MEDFSLSNSLSQVSVYESESFGKAYLDDAAHQIAGGSPPAISNEEISAGDVFLETYRVESDAIHGGMGSVWRVRHESWGTDLAMKRPQPRFFAEGSDRRKADFIAECEHWIGLGLHPNIVSCYYVREIGGVPTIFSEWMDGGSLKDAIESGRLYEGTETEVQERILDIAIQSAQGLQYAHGKGLIHQDVKPGNILLTGDWEAKAADFGLAKAQSQLTDGEKPAFTGYTPAYCPKEQTEGASAAWMDVYAWALTVLEMYAGRRLWETGADAASCLDNLDGATRVPVSGGMLALIRSIVVERDTADFAPAIETCLGLYREITGERFPRVAPRAVGRSADHMNNCALSYIDLGREDIALAIWEEAERADSRCVAAVYNAALYKYRHGRMDDVAAVAAVQSLVDDFDQSPEARLALARIQLECRNPGLSDTLDALERAGADPAELASMRAGMEANRFEPVCQFRHDGTGPVDVSPDGNYLLIHERAGEDSTETVTFCGLEDRSPISSLLREPNSGEPSEVRVRLSGDNSTAFGMYHKDPFLYKWHTADGEQVTAMVMRKLPGEQIVAFSFDRQGEHGILASNRGRLVFYDPAANISKPFGSFQGHFGLDMSSDGSRGLAFCTEENKVVVRGFGDESELEIPVEEPCFASFALEDACVLAVQGGQQPEIALFDVQTGAPRYRMPFPLMHEFSTGNTQFSVSMDGGRLMLRVRGGFMLFDIAAHRWLFTISEALTGVQSNLVFRAFLTDTGSRVFLDSYVGGLTGYRLPEFTEDSPWSLSVIHTTKERLTEEDAFTACCGKARAAADAGNIAEGLAHLAEAAAVGGGRFRSEEAYLSLVRTLSPRCTIREIGDPLPLKRTRALSAPVSTLSVSPSGKWIAAISEDGALALIDAASGETVCRITDSRFSPFKAPRWVGETIFALVTGEADDRPLAFRNGRDEGTMKISFMGQSLTRTEGGRVFAFDLSDAGTLPAAELERRLSSGAPAMPAQGVTDFAVPDGSGAILYRRSDGPVCRWSKAGGTKHLLTIGEECQVSGMAVSDDGRTGLQLCGDILNFSKAQTSSALAVFFDVSTGRLLHRFTDGAITTACAFSADSRWAVVGSEVIDLRTGSRKKLGLDNARLGCFLDDRFLIGLDNGGQLAVYLLPEGTAVRTADVGERPTALACSPDRNELYVGNARGEVITFFWDHAYTPDDGTRGRQANEIYFWGNSEPDVAPRETAARNEPDREVNTQARRRGLFGLFGQRNGKHN